VKYPFCYFQPVGLLTGNVAAGGGVLRHPLTRFISRVFRLLHTRGRASLAQSLHLHAYAAWFALASQRSPYIRGSLETTYQFMVLIVSDIPLEFIAIVILQVRV